MRIAQPLMHHEGIRRSRAWISGGFVLVVLLGLASRRFPSALPPFVGKYPGDALWALMVFLGWAFCKPQASTRTIAALAFTTSCLVEFSQLYQAPWINSIRSTTPGHLILGSTFSWPDIAAYAIGILFGAVLDASVQKTAGKHPSKWPWVLRFPVFLVIVITLWWAPMVLALMALSRWGIFEMIGNSGGFVLCGVVLFGWSSFIMKFVIDTRVEPFFNIRSLQNRSGHLFTPEPVHSFRDWLRLMFLGRE